MNVTAVLCPPTLHAVRSEHIVVLVSIWRLESMVLPCISEEWRGDMESMLTPIQNAVAPKRGCLQPRTLLVQGVLAECLDFWTKKDRMLEIGQGYAEIALMRLINRPFQG